MIQEKFDELVGILTSSTESGKVDWEQSSSKDEYQTKIGDNAISVGLFDPNSLASMIFSSDRSNKLYYYINVYNSKGLQVDSEERAVNEIGFAKLKNLYQIAKRKYFKADETLDDILDILKQ